MSFSLTVLVAFAHVHVVLEQVFYSIDVYSVNCQGYHLLLSEWPFAYDEPGAELADIR